MDYSLAAVKLFVAHLKPARPAKELASNGGAAFAIGSLIFQRVWLQVIFFRPLFSFWRQCYVTVQVVQIDRIRNMVFDFHGIRTF